MRDDDDIFWEVWRRLRAREPREGDLVVLSIAEQHWRRMRALEPLADGFNAASEAYEKTDGTTKEKQAAACRAAGFTGAEDCYDRVLVERWFTLNRQHPGDRDRALVLLREERGVSEGSVVRALRRCRAEMEKLVADGVPGSAGLREDIDSLSNGPAAIPSSWGE